MQHFIDQHAEEFRALKDPLGQFISVCIAVIFLICCYFAPNQVWPFRVLGMVGAVLWFIALWKIISNLKASGTLGDPFKNAQSVYVPFFVAMILLASVPTIIRLFTGNSTGSSIDTIVFDLGLTGVYFVATVTAVVRIKY